MSIRHVLIITCMLQVSVFAMNSVSEQKQKTYTMGMKIPNNTYATSPINPVHMTITYLGAADENKLEQAKSLLKEIHAMRPIRVSIAEASTLPIPDGSLPIRLLHIESTEIEKKFVEIHDKLGECEPGQPAKFADHILHVSTKNPSLAQELAAKEHAILIGGTLFIKPVGPFDPIIEFKPD